jgi:signal transduction histidine kinase
VRATNSLLDRLDQDFGKQRRFIANAAHELRTPLAVLRARVETIQDGAVREALLSDTDRMVVLVQQMLMMARLRDSQVSLADPIDIGTRVRQLVAHYAPVALAQRREITVDLDGPASCIRGNRQAFDSAVMNILENAVRAEPEDGCVHVIVGPGPVVSVRDHGAGVEEAELALMFEPFWRKDHGTPGSGLGLAIVRESMALHGGAVKASAAPDGGLVVRLQFPHPTAGAEAPATAQDISLPAEL